MRLRLFQGAASAAVIDEPAASAQDETMNRGKITLRERLRRDRGLLVLLLLFIVGLPLVSQRIYASDEIKYYAYLHSVIFDHDLDFTNDYVHWREVSEQKYGPLVESMLKANPRTGLPINEAPIGSALLWSPFYLLAHGFVLLIRAFGSKIAADGWSQPYITAVCYASYFYGWAGLLLIYALLRRMFSVFAATLAVIAAWLATPAIFYMVIAPPWSHSVSLFAVALFCFVWYRSRPANIRTPRQWALLGVCAGLMMLIREQDALFLSIPAVETLLVLLRPAWAMPSDSPGTLTRPDLVPGQPAAAQPIARPGALRDAPTGFAALVPLVIGWVICGICAAITFIPQLIVYRVTNGTFGPSSTVGEKLNWTSPHFFEVLFSPAYGLIPWTPLVIVALVGLALLWGRDRALALAFLVSFFAQVFVAGAFLTWMGASSFGQRRFINSTVIIAFGVAAVAAWLLAHGLPKWLVGVLAGLFVAWNLGLIVQYSAFWTSASREKGLVWPDIIWAQIKLPIDLPDIIYRFLFDRQSFYSKYAPK